MTKKETRRIIKEYTGLHVYHNGLKKSVKFEDTLEHFLLFRFLNKDISVMPKEYYCGLLFFDLICK